MKAETRDKVLNELKLLLPCENDEISSYQLKKHLGKNNLTREEFKTFLESVIKDTKFCILDYNYVCNGDHGSRDNTDLIKCYNTYKSMLALNEGFKVRYLTLDYFKECTDLPFDEVKDVKKIMDRKVMKGVL